MKIDQVRTIFSKMDHFEPFGQKPTSYRVKNQRLIKVWVGFRVPDFIGV